MKLLASDFDNTLWFYDHMKEKDLQAIKHFQKQGHLFGLCSGRSLDGVLKPSRPYDITYDFFILLSGGLILNRQQDIIFEKKIPLSLVKEIYDFTGQLDISVVCNDITYQLYKNSGDPVFGVEIQSLDDIHAEEVHAFSFHYPSCDIAKAHCMTQKILEKYGDVVEAYQNAQHIDLAKKGCSKGHGIQIIQDYFRLPEQHIYGIGDNYNDLPMLDVIKNSYSFDYAPQDVQTHAQKIVSQLYECIEDIEKTI